MLASAAVRSPKLLSLLKSMAGGQEKPAKKVLKGVIDAAEGVDAVRIRERQA